MAGLKAKRKQKRQGDKMMTVMVVDKCEANGSSSVSCGLPTPFHCPRSGHVMLLRSTLAVSRLTTSVELLD